MKSDFRTAARTGDTDQLRTLLDGGCDVDSRDRYGQTGLMLAAAYGHADAVRLLIQRGADLNSRAKWNLTALMLAIIRGHIGTARLLIDAGADLSATGGKGTLSLHGKTALDLAQERGDTATVEMLRRANAPTGCGVGPSALSPLADAHR